LRINVARLTLLVVSVGLPLLLILPDPGSDTSPAAGAAAASSLLDLELSTFDGDGVRLGTLASGKPLVVNFFASWCGPCVREMPDFEAVHRRRSGDVRFVGVNLQDSAEAAMQLVRATGVTYDVVRDERGELYRAVKGSSMPTTVFLTADGKVLQVRGGELSEPALEAQIDRLLAR